MYNVWFTVNHQLYIIALVVRRRNDELAQRLLMYLGDMDEKK